MDCTGRSFSITANRGRVIQTNTRRVKKKIPNAIRAEGRNRLSAHRFRQIRTDCKATSGST